MEEFSKLMSDSLSVNSEIRANGKLFLSYF